MTMLIIRVPSPDRWIAVPRRGGQLPSGVHRVGSELKISKPQNQVYLPMMFSVTSLPL